MVDKLTEKEIENFNIGDSNEYPVMPLRNTVLFPQQVIPIYIGRERSLKLVNDLYPFTLSSANFISLPGFNKAVKVNLSVSAPYLFNKTNGSIILPFDLDIF